jgi:simple sugar transport system permease protein
MGFLQRIAHLLKQSFIAIVIGLFAGAILMLMFGHDPITAYVALFKGAFGSLAAFMETLSFATPLMLTAITFAVGMKAGLFNIGAEGQVYLGAIGAVMIGGAIALPAGLHIVAATAFAMLLGILWAIPVALLKIWRGVHEVISAIMFNWIAFYLVMFLVSVFADPLRAERTVPALPTARYPVLMAGATLTAVIFVVIAVCILTYVILWRTKLGYELRLVGDNPDAARYAGISSKRAIFSSFVLGGLAAGLAGASQIIGRPPEWSLYKTMGTVSGFGFEGIGVALISRNHPIGGIFAAIFYGGLLHGGRFMEYSAGVSSELVVAIQGIIILALAVPEIITIVRRFRRGSSG